MSKFLNTFGNAKLSIAICSRCSFKLPYTELSPDRDKPGLWVCEPCNDEKDPWKLPPIQTEDISLRHPRLDEDISTYDPSLLSNEYDGYAITDDEGDYLIP